MRANWNKFDASTKTFAPKSNINENDFLLGISEQIAGLSIPGIIPNINLDKIIRAAVFPAETKPELGLSLTNFKPL